MLCAATARHRHTDIARAHRHNAQTNKVFFFCLDVILFSHFVFVFFFFQLLSEAVTRMTRFFSSLADIPRFTFSLSLVCVYFVCHPLILKAITICMLLFFFSLCRATQPIATNELLFESFVFPLLNYYLFIFLLAFQSNNTDRQWCESICVCVCKQLKSILLAYFYSSKFVIIVVVRNVLIAVIMCVMYDWLHHRLA